MIFSSCHHCNHEKFPSHGYLWEHSKFVSIIITSCLKMPSSFGMQFLEEFTDAFTFNNESNF
jgi:hypothetical protein